MLTRTLRAGTASLALLAATALVPFAQAQDMPPRAVGSLDVNAITKAPLWAQRTVEVDGEPKAVFDYLANNENWVPWFGGQITGVKGAAAARTFTLGNGAELVENIVAFNEPVDAGGEYAWSQPEGNPFGYSGHLGVLSVQPDAEDGEGSIVTISTFFQSDAPDSVLPTIEGGGKAITEGIRSQFGGEVGQEIGGNAVTTITTTRIVKAPIAQVWKVVAEDFGDVAEWASVIGSNTFEADAGKILGGRRECFIPGFAGKVVEKVTKFGEAAHEFEYDVLQGLPPFVTSGTSNWTMEAINDGTTRVVSTITMNVGEGTPPFALGMAKAAFGQTMTVSLDDLVHFVETGEPHPREIASR